MSYCDFVETAEPKERRLLHKKYHDDLYGFAIHDDNELFGRLILEINQAGLSWETILKKELSFREAYSNFDIHAVAAYTEEDRGRLLSNAGIIRNKLKVNAAIENAKAIQKIQAEYGSFEKWLLDHTPQEKTQWVKLFRAHFKFTGSEIVNEFLMSTGFLPGAHKKACSIYEAHRTSMDQVLAAAQS